jgi:hypothetical protein
VLKKGDYVRLLIAPNTRIGTIEGSKTEAGRVLYLFRQDKRVLEEQQPADCYVLERELAVSQRPSDAEIDILNRLQPSLTLRPAPARASPSNERSTTEN